MIRLLLLRPYRVAEPRMRHSDWMVRRIAQVAALGIAIIWLTLPRKPTREPGTGARRDPLADEFVSSPRMREFLHGNSIGKPLISQICRLLVLRLSVYAKTRERATSQDRNFALRLHGPIDQIVLRNLLIWQNHILPSSAPHEVDIALVLAGGSGSDARLLDLFSIALMLERVRSVSVFWDEQTAISTTSLVMSERELRRWHVSEQTCDLGRMPRDIIQTVALRGSCGGVKLLQHGRRYANDFLKLALPGRFIVAVGLREGEDGTAESEDLELWLDWIDRLRVRYPQAAFVVLNRLAPSQWRQWPTHLRFARHQGLSLQDSVCLAQIADGYVGVLDVFGLAAHSAGRPGIYVPLEERDPSWPESAGDNSKASQIMVGSRRHADIAAAIGTFGGFAPIQRTDSSLIPQTY